MRGWRTPGGRRGFRDTPASVGSSGPWPGFGGVPPAIAGAGAAGATGLASDAGHTHAGVTSIDGLQGALPAWKTVTTIAALQALDAANQTGGQVVYMNGVGIKDDWVLTLSALTVDNLTVVTALNKAGYQWLRAMRPAPSNAAVAFWAVAPTTGSDEAIGGGTTAAAARLVALKTMQELKRRLWALEIKIALVTVELLESMPSTDVGTWNTKWNANGQFMVTGVLGSVTGPAGAIDNTLYTGSLTSAPTVPADVPTADDYEIVDTAIPVSYTASGLLAAGVLFQRTNGAARYWWALKDLGSKTLRVTAPMADITALTTWGGGAMANGDTYKAFQLPSFYNQDWGYGPMVFVRQVNDITPFDSNAFGTDAPGKACVRRRCDIGGADNIYMSSWSNCLIRLAGNRGASNCTPHTNATLSGGGAIGTGALVLSFLAGNFKIAGCWTTQGVAVKTNDGARVQFEREWAMHDCTVPCLQPTTPNSSISFVGPTAGQGMSGKGNTSSLVLTNIGGEFYYGFSGAAPPFNTACTSDAAPIVIGANSYTVAQMPAANDTALIATVVKATLP